MSTIQGMCPVRHQPIPPPLSHRHLIPQITDDGDHPVRRIRDGTPGEYNRTDAEMTGTSKQS
jgi:hypothetical protein